MPELAAAQHGGFLHGHPEPRDSPCSPPQNCVNPNSGAGNRRPGTATVCLPAPRAGLVSRSTLRVGEEFTGNFSVKKGSFRATVDVPSLAIRLRHVLCCS